jgi:hypothetical protein
MAYSFNADDYHDLWLSTKSYFEDQLQDVIIYSHPILRIIAGNDMVKSSPIKGKRFVETILARTIDNVKAIKPTDKLSFSANDLLEQVEIDPKLVVTGVPLYTTLLSLNNTNELIDLLKINQLALREGMMKAFAKSLYSAGATDQDLQGLPYMLSDNPYSSSLKIYNLQRGGTPGDSHEFWRNKAGLWVTGVSTDPDVPSWPTTRDDQAQALFQAINDMLLVLNKSGKHSDLKHLDPKANCIVMNMKFYSLLQYARFKYMHINNTVAEKTDLGIMAMDHMNVPVYLDPDCPVNKIYFLDTSQIGLLHVPGENFTSLRKEMPDALGYNYITKFMGNWVIHKAQNCGVITLNTTAATNGLPKDCNICNGLDVYVDYLHNNIPNGISGGDSLFENSNYSASGVFIPHA